MAAISKVGVLPDQRQVRRDRSIETLFAGFGLLLVAVGFARRGPQGLGAVGLGALLSVIAYAGAPKMRDLLDQLEQRLSSR
jgi:hypothetical protein